MALRHVLSAALSLVCAGVVAQVPFWPGYLPPERATEVRGLLTELSRTDRLIDAGHGAITELLETLHARARDLPLSYQGYRTALTNALHGVDERLLDGAGESAQAPASEALAELREERDRLTGAIVDALAANPPQPGSPSHAAVIEWLTARSGELPDPLLVAAETLRSEVESLLARSASGPLGGFADALRAAAGREDGGRVPDGLSAEDRARYALSIWWIGVLAEVGTPAVVAEKRADALARLGGALSPLDGTAADGVRALSSDFRREAGSLAALAVDASVLAAFTARAFAVGERYLPETYADRVAVARFIFVVTEAPAEVVVRAVVGDPLLAFAVRAAESLLAEASELQRYRMALALGVPTYVMPTLPTTLYRVRSLAAEAQLPHEHPDLYERSSYFAEYLEEGTAYVEAVERWGQEERSRAGSEFRWSVLPALSHPYAQYLLAAEPRGQAYELVERFALETHRESLARVSDDAVRGSAGTGLPFDSSYRVAAPEQAERLYRSFASVAQAQDPLPPAFAEGYAAGFTLAGYWSHIYGVHVYVVPEADAPAGFRERVVPWFDLASAAYTEFEALSQEVRGYLALQTLVEEQMSPALAAAGARSARFVSPTLNRAREHLADLAAFRTEPEALVDDLARLWPDVRGSVVDLLEALLAEATRVAARLEAVEVPDRRLVARAAGGVR